MKKTLSLFFMITLPFLLAAQEFNGGLLLGFNLSEISGDEVTGPNQPGLYTGIFTNVYVSERSSLQMELDYIQKGTRKKADTTDYGYSIRMHYVELHLLYHYDIKRFTLEAGPSLGYLAADPKDKVSGYVFDDFYPLDFSLEVGLYYRLLENLRFAVRYSNSVLPISNNPSGHTWTLKKGEYNEVLAFNFYLTILKPKK
jgi:hypothetical protein